MVNGGADAQQKQSQPDGGCEARVLPRLPLTGDNTSASLIPIADAVAGDRTPDVVVR